jgi:hypothetical protein
MLTYNEMFLLFLLIMLSLILGIYIHKSFILNKEVKHIHKAHISFMKFTEDVLNSIAHSESVDIQKYIEQCSSKKGGE